MTEFASAQYIYDPWNNLPKDKKKKKEGFVFHVAQRVS